MQTTPETHSDPVCGMRVDGAAARERGLAAEYEGQTYYFCGRGRLLEFSDDPKRFFEPGYIPHM